MGFADCQDVLCQADYTRSIWSTWWCHGLMSHRNTQQTLFTLLHETEAGTAFDHVTMNFEPQDGSSLQIATQKEF